eukprot:COSAG06_NODE_41211_length_393_cov_3.163265_1_plen_115_part_10
MLRELGVQKGFGESRQPSSLSAAGRPRNMAERENHDDVIFVVTKSGAISWPDVAMQVGCDAALAAGLAQPAIVRARGVLECESGRKSMSEAAGVWWRDVLGGMVRGLGGYCSGGA